MAESAGFQKVETRDLSDDARPTLRAWRENAEASREEVVELIGQTSWQAFVVSCTVLQDLWAEQKLGYGLVTAVKPE